MPPWRTCNQFWHEGDLVIRDVEVILPRAPPLVVTRERNLPPHPGECLSIPIERVLPQALPQWSIALVHPGLNRYTGPDA
jgi:hypothetical protein